MNAEVLYEVRDQTAWIALNRAQAMNATFETIRAEIPLALSRAEADDSVRVIIFSGAGERAFREKRKPRFKGR